MASFACLHSIDPAISEPRLAPLARDGREHAATAARLPADMVT